MTILILGAGESGLGSALLAKKNNYNVFISDAGDILDSTKEKLIYSSINFEENSHEKAKTLNVDLVIKSPGISDCSDIVKFLDDLESEDARAYAFAHRPSTAWRVAKIVCVRFDIFKTNLRQF